jgi:hypothetical protein
MSATVIVNRQTVVHKDSGGIATSGPDVCLTPVGNSVMPVPYTNVARSVDTTQGSRSVTMDGNSVMLKGSVFAVSQGDEPGKAGGVASGVTGGKAKFVNYSTDVYVDGKPVCRRLDPMVSNLSVSSNTQPAPLLQENAFSECNDAEGHTLSITFVFKDPDVLTGRVIQPILNLPYTITGSETLKNDGSEPYVGKLHKIATPGEFVFSFDELDLDERPVVPPKKPATK